MSYQFTIPGRALVTLIVTDSRGTISTAVVPIQVVTFIPQVQVSPPRAIVGQALTFVTQIQLDPGDTISHYIWTFGDQTPTQTTQTGTVTHRYRQPGQYHVQVQAIDGEQVPGSATIIVTIQAVAGAGSSTPGKGDLLLVIGGGLLLCLALGTCLVWACWRAHPPRRRRAW